MSLLLNGQSFREMIKVTVSCDRRQLTWGIPMTSGSRVFKTSRLVSRTDSSPFSISWELGFIGFSFKKDETRDLLIILPAGSLWPYLDVLSDSGEDNTATQGAHGIQQFWSSVLNFYFKVHLGGICWNRHCFIQQKSKNFDGPWTTDIPSFSQAFAIVSGAKFSKTQPLSGVDCDFGYHGLTKIPILRTCFLGS